MVLAIFLLLCAAVFPVQLFLCFRVRNVWIRMIPLALAVFHIICCVVVASVPENGLVQSDGQLAALIAMFIGFSALAADALAWLIWAIVKGIQKRRK